MPPRSRTTAPPIDIDDARRRLADGKIVRVGIGRSAHFPEGGTGRIRFIGDPETDGEEFVQVEVLVNGTKDVLPFTPADLSPVRRSNARGATTNGAVARGAQPRASRARRPRVPPAAPANTSAVSALGAGGARSAPVTTGGPPSAWGTIGERSAPAATNAPPEPPSPPAAAPSAAPDTAQVKRSRPVRRRATAVSISIATADTDPPQWRLDVRVGSRAAVRAATLSGAQVWRLVEALGDDGVTAAVTAVLTEQRLAAVRRADALTAELAAVRAELDSLPGE